MGSVRRRNSCETLANRGESNKTIYSPPAFVRIHLFMNVFFLFLLSFFVCFKNTVDIDNYAVCPMVHRLFIARKTLYVVALDEWNASSVCKYIKQNLCFAANNVSERD